MEFILKHESYCLVKHDDGRLYIRSTGESVLFEGKCKHGFIWRKTFFTTVKSKDRLGSINEWLKGNADQTLLGLDGLRYFVYSMMVHREKGEAIQYAASKIVGEDLSAELEAAFQKDVVPFFFQQSFIDWTDDVGMSQNVCGVPAISDS